MVSAKVLKEFLEAIDELNEKQENVELDIRLGNGKRLRLKLVKDDFLKLVENNEASGE